MIFLYQNPLIQPVITPRFAISCSETLMQRLGEIAAEKNLAIQVNYSNWHQLEIILVNMQTHLCEQEGEVDFTMSLFPGFKHYTDIYTKTGLVTEKVGASMQSMHVFQI